MSFWENFRDKIVGRVSRICNSMLELNMEVYIMLYSALNILLFGRPFFSYIWFIKKSIVALCCFCIFVFIVSNLLFSIIFNIKTVKFLSIAIFLVNSTSLYFMNRFKVQLDISMLMNVLETNFSETREFIDASLLLYILFFGIIPSFLIGRFISIINYRTLYTKLKFIAVNTAAIILIILISIKTPRIYEFLKRDNRYTVNYFIPINYLGNSVAAVLTKVRSAIPQKIIKIDIKQKRIGNDRKSLIVFILGESARTQNFSLNGYSRSTNKFLEKYNVISFKNVYSCGVSTAHSIPCIFSHLDRAHFTIGEAIKYENLLDIFKKIDYRVIWSSNNGGCKKVCDRVSYKKTVGLSRGRFDEALTTSFRREIKHLGDRNAFLLLNQIGSHEMYHKRYPKEFEEFKPSCKTTLDKCDYMERLNSYDNTILYSSYNIGQILEILSEELNDSFDTMLIYVSDHGDSLGEDNVWLHGMPYARANDYVKKVPMLLWFSNSFKKTYNIDEICLRNKIDHELSHDNIFHSLLGLLWIESEYYDENLDIFKDCRLP